MIQKKRKKIYSGEEGNERKEVLTGIVVSLGQEARDQAAAIIRLMGISTGMKSATPSLLNRSVTVEMGGTYFPKTVLITPVPIPTLVMLGPFSFSVQPGNNFIIVTGKMAQQPRIS